MKIGIYAGTFSPWHDGHEDILKKALEVFDLIIIAQGVNPAKSLAMKRLPEYLKNRYADKVNFDTYNTLLADYVKTTKACAVIRGIRNGQDFESEKVMQYWNEDLGLTVPTMYFITDRKLVHMSSTALRHLEDFS